MPRKNLASDAVLAELRAFGLAFPGAHTKSPWPGHLDLAVHDKTFAYLSVPGEPLAISCKLPRSSGVALMLPFATPTPYGLGKSGWVSAQFAADDAAPVEMLKQWIEESYRAQAPKKLVAQLSGAAPVPAAPARIAKPAKPTRAKAARIAKPAKPTRAKPARAKPARTRARSTRA